MSQQTRRFSIVAVVFLAAGSLIGGLLSDGVQADPQRVEDQFWTFGEVLALIEEEYVGETDSKELVEDAIVGMLRTLDPHSNYLNEETFGEMRDEQRGKFHGLGIQITKRGSDKPLTIIAPIEETPAWRAGLRSGDIISQIEGEPTIDLTVTQAVRLLKGDKGTEVTITIDRPGMDESFDVTIERDEIPIDSIRLAYMINSDVGLIRISNFTSTTADELDAAAERLLAQGMKNLILDLRGNPGGLLEQAVRVTERFIDEDKLVVYTRGRISGSDQDYVSKRGVSRIEIPLIVLVDRSSASASEIVSGAVQDHDRGLVVGENTFGKGLVQRVIPLRGGGAVAVTTAKYYTPSGRLIQRDYTDLEEYYLNRAADQEKAAGNGDLIDPSGKPTMVPDELAEDDREIFYTASGRKVYGGGGIRPDYMVKAKTMPKVLLQLDRENLLFDYAVLYNNSHPDLEKGFAVDQKATDGFLAFVKERGFAGSAEEMLEHNDVIALRLHAQIARVKWDAVEQFRILHRADPQIQRALKLFGEAAKLARLNEYADPQADADALHARLFDRVN